MVGGSFYRPRTWATFGPTDVTAKIAKSATIAATGRLIFIFPLPWRYQTSAARGAAVTLNGDGVDVNQVRRFVSAADVHDSESLGLVRKALE